MNYVAHVITEESVTIITDGSPVTIRSDNDSYNAVVSLLLEHKFSEAIDESCMAIKIKNQAGENGFDVVGDTVLINGEELPEALSKMLINLVTSNISTAPLVAFWNNLKSNPSFRSRKCLYDFLLANSCTITEDGHFICYKAVASNYLDKHSGTFDNQIGCVVEMDRSEVDDDPQHTCSKGLHVAAYSYARDVFLGQNDHLVLVKVNPADVVAVPYDYNNTKIRVCKYEVVDEIDVENRGEIKDLVWSNEEDLGEDGCCPECGDEAFDGWNCDVCDYDSLADEEEEEEEDVVLAVEKCVPSKEYRLNVPRQILEVAGYIANSTALVCYDNEAKSSGRIVMEGHGDWVGVVNNDGRLRIPVGKIRNYSFVFHSD